MPQRQAASEPPEPHNARPGREAQRRRTRSAIVDAAIGLVKGGGTPSVDEIAAAADVSRRTVYMHFPTHDQLLLDATVGALSTSVVDEALRSDNADPLARVDALVKALTHSAEQTLSLGRKIIALTVDPPDTGPEPKRGQRRTEWIDTALAPLRDQLTHEQYQRLAAGLSIIVGWEAMVILRDVHGLDPHRESDIMRWAAASLVRAILQE